MFAIRAFVGANGGGKTLAMVESMALPAWAAGRPVVANLRLHPERVGLSPDLYVPLESWRQIPTLAGCVLLLDEISSVLPSRQAMSVPPQLVRILNQLRKGDVQLGWTAPNWARCDVLLREVTQAVTVCAGSFPDRWDREASGPARWNRPALTGADGRRIAYDRGWRPNRLFTWRTYDAMEFDEFSFAAVKDVRPRRVQRYWRPRHSADLAYETLEAVSLLDHLDDVGTCVVCGGHRTRPKCSCIPAAPKGHDELAMTDDRPPLGPVQRRPRAQRVRP